FQESFLSEVVAHRARRVGLYRIIHLLAPVEADGLAQLVALAPRHRAGKAVAGQLRVLRNDDVQENCAAADLGLLDADIREQPLVPNGMDGPANALPWNGELVAHLQA